MQIGVCDGCPVQSVPESSPSPRQCLSVLLPVSKHCLPSLGSCWLGVSAQSDVWAWVLGAGSPATVLWYWLGLRNARRVDRSDLATNAETLFSSLPVGLDTLCGMTSPGQLGPKGCNCPWGWNQASQGVSSGMEDACFQGHWLRTNTVLSEWGVKASPVEILLSFLPAAWFLWMLRSGFLAAVCTFGPLCCWWPNA